VLIWGAFIGQCANVWPEHPYASGTSKGASVMLLPNIQDSHLKVNQYRETKNKAIFWST
jgi:hypothetical protein